ncbi:MAG: MBL fold metallo-hydrolase [Verrucomicrobiota bacterium]
MQFTDLNEQGGIGSSATLLEIGPYTLLIDSGIHPKLEGKASLPRLDKIRDRQVDCILLTHCHLDHVGSIPVAARYFPDAHILMTRASALLAPRMLRNSVNVMNRKREESGNNDYPFYTFKEIEALDDRILGLAFERAFCIDTHGPELSITLYPAGHVAGAAGIRIECSGESIFVTGDCLFRDNLTLPGAQFPIEAVDTLITETTRGATEPKASADRNEEWDALFEDMRMTFRRGGNVLIPVFALGRMQEMLTRVAARRHEPWLKDIPIYCSGLGMDLVDYFDQIAKRVGGLEFSRKTVKQLKVRPPDWNWCRGKQPSSPTLMLLSSGMLVEHTPSYRMASGLLHDPKNMIQFIGYCDPDTPGGAMLQMETGEEYLFELLDYKAQLYAEIRRYDLSGHAERNELVEFASAVTPKRIILTHGDPEAREWFRNTLKHTIPDTEVLDPQTLDTLELSS